MKFSEVTGFLAFLIKDRKQFRIVSSIGELPNFKHIDKNSILLIPAKELILYIARVANKGAKSYFVGINESTGDLYKKIYDIRVIENSVDDYIVRYLVEKENGLFIIEEILQFN